MLVVKGEMATQKLSLNFGFELYVDILIVISSVLSLSFSSLSQLICMSVSMSCVSLSCLLKACTFPLQEDQFTHKKVTCIQT
jgi:hypothetical protein